MKRIPSIFLQIVLILIGLITIFILLRFPRLEGRAKDLDLISIYSDPFIMLVYLLSLPFFFALYEALKLLNHIGRNEVFSLAAVKCLMKIKFYAIALGLSIICIGVYIVLTHHPDDDPAGFMALCLMGSFASLVIATAFAIFEKLLRKAVELKSENELTI